MQWCEKLDAAIGFYSPEPSSHAYGACVSLVDFAVYSWIDGLATNPSVMALDKKPWGKFARLTAIHKAVEEMPAVKKWCSERPVTAF